VPAVAVGFEDHRPAAVEDARQLRGEQLHRRALVGARQGVEQLQLAVGVERTGEGPQRLDRHAGDGLGRGDQGVGQPVPGELDHHVVHGEAAGALQDVQGHDVDPRLTQGGRDRAQGAGTVGHDESQEIGHGSSGVVLEVRARSPSIAFADQLPAPGSPGRAVRE
jgi:hypothetical protein